MRLTEAQKWAIYGECCLPPRAPYKRVAKAYGISEGYARQVCTEIKQLIISGRYYERECPARSSRKRHLILHDYNAGRMPISIIARKYGLTYNQTQQIIKKSGAWCTGKRRKK